MNKQSLNRKDFYNKVLDYGDVVMITIPINPITKKNSNQIITNKKTGKPFLIPSKQYKKYEKECNVFLMKYRGLKIDKPINLECHYYMQRRIKVDLVNLLESTCDVLVKYGVIEDDNSSIVVSHDGSRVHYDKNNPRTEIYIRLI